MLRLTLLLCIGMFAALMIAGEDRGQLRPGLAEAAAEGAQPGPDAVARTDSPEPAAASYPAVVVAAEPEPAAEPRAVVARAEPEPYVEPQREVVTAVEEPVFSLAAAGNEAVPAGPETEAQSEAQSEVQPEAQPEAMADGAGTIWYVNADQVNVRAEPSTDAEVLGKLVSGEATLVVQAVDADWARIVIQGDGVEGFVALRYLSPEAP